MIKTIRKTVPIDGKRVKVLRWETYFETGVSYGGDGVGEDTDIGILYLLAYVDTQERIEEERWVEYECWLPHDEDGEYFTPMTADEEVLEVMNNCEDFPNGKLYYSFYNENGVMESEEV